MGSPPGSKVFGCGGLVECVETGDNIDLVFLQKPLPLWPWASVGGCWSDLSVNMTDDACVLVFEGDDSNGTHSENFHISIQALFRVSKTLTQRQVRVTLH
jgi:hypothetical protein